MARPHAPLPGCLGATFTTSEARAAGVSSRRLAGPDIERVVRGVYRRIDFGAGDASDLHPAERWRQLQFTKACAVLRALSHGQYFSHATAAVILGLPVPHRADNDIDAACSADRWVSRAPGVRSHRLAPGLVRVGIARGLPTASPADVWAMLGDELSLPDLVALGDAVIRRPRIPGTQRLERAPLATLADLEAVITAMRRRGNAALRQALPLLVTGSASAPESHLRLKLHEWGLPQPELDVDVYNAAGRLLGASELAYPQYKIALEYEGSHHRVHAAQWNRDIDKYHAYESAGWRAIRITGSLQYGRALVLRSRVESALRDRGWTPMTRDRSVTCTKPANSARY